MTAAGATESSRSASTWHAVCLCAQWCGVCRQYQVDFLDLQRQHFPDWRFVWLDVEDDEAVLEGVDMDIETFPTLLIAQGEQARFLGVLPPQAPVLQRLLHALVEQATDPQAPTPGVDAQAQALWQAVRLHLQAGAVDAPTGQGH